MIRRSNDESKKRVSLREFLASSSDTVGAIGLIAFVVIVVAASLAIVHVTDDRNDGTASASDRSSVTFPTESDLFAPEDDEIDAARSASACGPGRVDLLTASEDEINAVRGLRQTEVAELVVANREFLVEPADLVRIGISDAQVSRVLLSREACIGEVAPDDSLPNTVCQEDQLDINTAFISEIESLQGIDEPQAEVLVENRPYVDVQQIVATEDVLERTITWLALNGTCLRQIQNIDDLQPDVVGCGQRVDLLTATLDEITGVRGLHQLDTAEIVVSNQSSLDSVADLVDLGIDPSRVGRLMLSREACFGDVPVDEEMPTATCAPDDLNLNTATIIEILDTEGITHDTADLLVFNRPFVSVDELVASPDLVDSAITWLSIRGTCFGPEEPVDGLCAPGRIDIQEASLDELIQVRGLRRQSVARLIFDNRDAVDGLESLLSLGVEPSVAGKLLRSQQTCFGPQLPDDELPDDTCGPLGLDLNSADIAEMITLDGLTHLQADLIIADRPFTDPSDLLQVSGIDPKTITSLAVIEACIEAAPLEAG